MSTKRTITTPHFTQVTDVDLDLLDEWLVRAPRGTVAPGEDVTVHLRSGKTKVVHTSRYFHIDNEDGWVLLYPVSDAEAARQKAEQEFEALPAEVKYRRRKELEREAKEMAAQQISRERAAELASKVNRLSQAAGHELLGDVAMVWPIPLVWFEHLTVRDAVRIDADLNRGGRRG